MKLAIFDLDGTLFDTKDVNYFAYKEAVSKFGFTIDYDYYCKACNGRHYEEFLPLITTGDKDVLLKMHQLKKDAYPKYLEKARPNRHLLNLMRGIKDKYKIALVTTASKKNTDEILEAYHIDELFDLILTRENVRKVKPDPEGFLKAMDYFKADVKDTIIFEDSDAGIEAAERSGAEYVRVYGYN